MISKIIKYVRNPYLIIPKLWFNPLIRMIPDKLYISLCFRAGMGYWLDWRNPETFNEKIQWMKLYDRDPKYTMLVDKSTVKEYVGNLIGKQYIIPTLAILNSLDEFEIDKLPSQFVLKCTHDSGGVFVCEDKNLIDFKALKKFISKRLKTNYYYLAREWPYKNIRPRIIIETYVVDNEDGELRDYKLYCFDGYVKAVLVATNRQSQTEELCFDYFDAEFNHLELTNHWHPNAKIQPHKPKNWETMIKLAQKLSTGFPHVRVDLYEANGQIYFGELTFSDMGGQLKIHPSEWDKEWGELFVLPKLT